MHKTARLKVHLKLLVTLGVVALLIAIVFVNIRMTGEPNSLNEAVEGGELALTAVGRSYKSLMHFVQENQSQAEALLKAARVSIENAEKKLGSAGRTRDVFTTRMVSNYKIISGASEAMAQGIDNLLAINGELKNALTFYNQGEYANSAEQASQALYVLTPFLTDLDMWNSSLNGLNYNSIASGHRNRATLAVAQYQSEQEIYLQYVLLLKSLLEGKDYLKTREVIDEKLKLLQSAIANEDYAAAKKLLQEINDLLQTLKDPRFDNATETASQLEPGLLEGNAFDAAQDLKTRLKDLAGIQQFETYLQGLEKFVASSNFLAQGEPEAAEQAANDGIGILRPGQPYLSDPELQRLYEGLGQAFNSLLMRIKGRPDLG